MTLQLNNLKQNDLIKASQRFAPAIVSIAVLLFVSYLLAKITWQLFEPAPTLSKQASPSAQISRKNTRNNPFQQQLIALNNAHLFGIANAPVAKQAIKDAPETTLNLTLRGILSAQPMDLASAIISTGKRAKEMIYGIGDNVPGNATIQEIHPTHIILMRNGRLETLKLPEKSVGGIAQKKRGTTSGELNMHQTPDKILGDIRRNIMKNPTSFGQYAIPVPVSKNGKLQGYRLRPQKKGRELFRQFGLQRNDIVTQVNGVQLNDPVQSMAALRKLSSASNINLIVLRNGISTPIQFNIR